MPLSNSNVEIQDLEWKAAQSQVSDGWYDLLENGNHNLYLSPDWINAIASAHNYIAKLRALVAHKHNRIVGILPYQVETVKMFGIPMKKIALAGMSGYHQDIVAEDRQELLRALFAKYSESRWHVFQTAGLVAGSNATKAVKNIARDMGGHLLVYPGESSPYLRINTSWEEFLASKSGNFRYTLKRKEKALRKNGDLQERWFFTHDDIEDLFEAMLKIEEHSWKTKANIAISDTEHEQNYYRMLLPFLAKRKALFAMVLYLDKQPVAYFLCCFWQGRVCNLKTSFHESYSKLAPGSVVIHFAVRKAFELGAKEVDFLGDAQHHKLLWSDSVRHHEIYYLFSRRIRARSVGMIKKCLHTFRAPDMGGPIYRKTTS